MTNFFIGAWIGLIITCFFFINKIIKEDNPTPKPSQEENPLDISRYMYEIEERYEGPSCPNPLDSSFFYRSLIYKDGKLIKTSKWYEENKDDAVFFAKYFINCEAKKDLENQHDTETRNPEN